MTCTDVIHYLERHRASMLRDAYTCPRCGAQLSAESEEAIAGKARAIEMMHPGALERVERGEEAVPPDDPHRQVIPVVVVDQQGIATEHAVDADEAEEVEMPDGWASTLADWEAEEGG